MGLNSPPLAAEKNPELALGFSTIYSKIMSDNNQEEPKSEETQDNQQNQKTPQPAPEDRPKKGAGLKEILNSLWSPYPTSTKADQPPDVI
jgi:hypothetical protein